MNWLKFLVGLAAIVIAGCAAYFSVTGLGVLFAGASISVMVMAGTLEFAKLVAATYLKQMWGTIKGFNKWYLTFSVGILMIITSAGIFGYLSNAFQQQSLQLQQVDREVEVHQTKIDQNTTQITQLSTQITEFNTNQGKILDGGTVNSRLIRSIDARDKEISKINDKISNLQAQTAEETEKINQIRLENIDLEKEVGGFRFIAEAFGIELKNVVKFFIFLIVIVFDPLAIALIIAFNGLIMKNTNKTSNNTIDTPLNTQEYQIYGDKEKQREAIIEMMKGDEELGLYDEPINLSEKDAEVFFNEIENPSEPNEALIKAAERYKDEKKKEIIIDDSELNNLKRDYNVRGIDLDGDGSIDGLDTDGDGLIDTVTSHPNRAMVMKNILPYYARPGFNWNDKDKWINDQNAVNYWVAHRKI